jgi:hypothetical protein
MKDANAQQEDVTGLFRKFGGDAKAYKEFAPAEIPAAAHPAAPSVAPAPAPAPAPASLHVMAPTPAAPVRQPAVTPAIEPLPVAANETPPVPAAPRELDQLFARLDACAPIPAPAAARGLMAHWRRPG